MVSGLGGGCETPPASVVLAARVGYLQLAVLVPGKAWMAALRPP